MSQDSQIEKVVSQDAYPVPTQPVKPVNEQQNVSTPQNTEKRYFPYPEHNDRLRDYEFYNRLFMGQHWEAFNVRIGDEKYTREYQKLRYVMANFAGLVSKIIADMLFSEEPDIKVPDGDQEFIDSLIDENNLHTQNYESALSNSALGDAVYRLRVGPRNKGDVDSTVIIEDITPSIYFPAVDGFNVRANPGEEKLAWTYKYGNNTYLREEIHRPGIIENRVFLMQGTEILGAVPFATAGLPDLQPTQVTGVDESLLVHVRNWRAGNRYFGISDYFDLQTLFYAINNRLTKIDNILDKHGDPILTVPPGVLDDKGQVQKKALGIIEIREGETGKPEYIVWDAKLDSAFDEIDKLIELFYMVSETSPDALGMGTGQSDSGRALKFKLMRTIAKAARKKLYYDQGIKKVLFIAQKLAKAHNLKVGGKTLQGNPVIPEIEWYDGLPMDMTEQVDVEAKRLDSGTTTVADSIMRLDGVDEDIAQAKAKEIKKENEITLPKSGLSTPFGPNGGASDNKQMPMDNKNAGSGMMNGAAGK